MSELINPIEDAADENSEIPNSSSSIEEEVISLDLSEDYEHEGNPESINEFVEKFKTDFLKSLKARGLGSISMPHVSLSFVGS